MKKQLFSKIKDYLLLLRFNSWLKNIFVFIPSVFSKHILEPEYFASVLAGFIAFSLASSTVYVFNDIVDASKDAVHPLKKNRPLASGRIKSGESIILLTSLFLITMLVTSQLKINFSVIVWGYIVLNLFYSLYLKNIVIIDLMCISIGFILRVLGGAVIISVYLSNWLILTTIFLSLFLAAMKRRVEIASFPNAVNQRSVLQYYSLGFIDQITSIAAAGIIICYSLYSVSEKTVIYFNSESLVYTTIFVVFGIFRYMYVVYHENKGENVVEVLYNDKQMLINSIAYILVTFYIIYL
ncbi:MAG: decaprenyl-phosphate phosphoribosyltransferase [Melioribacteraceae bacterium]|nr:decaprenyl-phosphate phosphoribosyltransferase [Melioribacteraceae bacterium]